MEEIISNPKRYDDLDLLYKEIERYGKKRKGDCTDLDIDALMEKYNVSSDLVKYFRALYVINYGRKNDCKTN